MYNVHTPIALRYLLNRKHQITTQMSRLVDVSPKWKWDERAKAEFNALQEAYKKTVNEINLLESL
tara:strand:+ start:1740 stop:1934 length:195 start_codon:yes stop_codon:yes gene_type:complete